MGLHSDQSLVVPDPWKEPWALNVIWCLHDCKFENGSTLFIPGSNKWVNRSDVPPNAVDMLQPFEAKAGSIIVMEGRVRTPRSPYGQQQLNLCSRHGTLPVPTSLRIKVSHTEYVHIRPHCPVTIPSHIKLTFPNQIARCCSATTLLLSFANRLTGPRSCHRRSRRPSLRSCMTGWDWVSLPTPAGSPSSSTWTSSLREGRCNWGEYIRLADNDMGPNFAHGHCSRHESRCGLRFTPWMGM